jgi:hypothetical protein
MKPVVMAPVRKARMLHQRGQEIDIVADAVDHELVQRCDLTRRSLPRGSGAQVTSLAIIGS